MSNTALIEVGDDVTKVLIDFKNDESIRAVKLIIEGEALQVAETINVTGSYEEDFNGLQDHLNPKEPCFVMTRLAKTVAHPEFLLLVYIPTSCPVRPRTIFASGRVPVQRKLSQVFTGMADYFVDTASEVTYDAFVHVNKKDESAMSLEELQMREESHDTHVGQVQLPTHDTFTWPVEDALNDALKQFAAGEGPKMVAGKASDTGGAISLSGTADSLEEIDNAGPRYVAIRYDNNGAEVKVFVLYCPDTAPARQKMMSSTCKQSFMKACKEIELDFDKTFEIRDVSEFTDINLDQLVNPTNIDHGYGEIKIIRKPKRPGRR